MYFRRERARSARLREHPCCTERPRYMKANGGSETHAHREAKAKAATEAEEGAMLGFDLLGL